jgi:hypothetical protein
LVCAEYFASTIVAEATLVKVRSVHDREDPKGVDAFVYTLSAKRLIRGQIDEVFRVYEGNDSGRATFEWKIGREYLLFLSYSSTEKAWKLDGCGNSGPSSNAKVVLRQIEEIQASHSDGFIHGAIRRRDLSAPISEVRVEARGANGTYSSKTNSRGVFEIRVPAGQYALRAVKTGFSFYTDDFSYENPLRLLIEPGGCAQVQLVSAGEKSQ